MTTHAEAAKNQPHPLYYLNNFRRVLAWVVERYNDILTSEERTFIATFNDALPTQAQALLVRMVMRKGIYFRYSKLIYAEIGDQDDALAPLLQHGMIVDNPTLSLADAGRLLTAGEVGRLATHLGHTRRATKAQLLSHLESVGTEARPWNEWYLSPDQVQHSDHKSDPLYELTVMTICDRLRLMFFGNLHQAWSTFVLEELGLFRFETVPFDRSARPFNHGSEIDTYMALHACREAFDAGVPASILLPQIPTVSASNTWLNTRRERLVYNLAYQLERSHDVERALSLYNELQYPGARLRRIRILEHQGRFNEALTLTNQAHQRPENEAESQSIARILPRLCRKLGLPLPSLQPNGETEIIELKAPALCRCVEEDAVQALHTDQSPVYFVENSLINSLLGLLLWPAVFANVPGAFFNPYQAGPADLNQPDFQRRRQDLINAQLAKLDDGTYKSFMRSHFQEKQGMQSPFVYWELLTDELLELSLRCIPATHLKAMFTRILFDIPANRSGLPDLIQFWPCQYRYVLLEVKGPGDRLQDNQKRWLDYFSTHDIPAKVVMVGRPDIP
ncbi:VRR-NUC domain-containing protein [Salinispirillum sp. LH 10-3-1]|uniref:phosphodiesterase I n=1 Tax=Salinispirillum sp. LH 10-3-1 TaxID=2952525 RepID=A0AB38YCG8_9GAMM